MKLTILPIILLAVQASADNHLPVTCMSAPVTPLFPGLAVNARLDSQGKRCEATLAFSNPDFFPVRFDFKAIECPGYEEAEFRVPQEVPNGDAFILWRCANQQSTICTQATITGGSEDANSIEFSQSGIIRCILPVATQTTLITVVEPSTTFTKTATSTILSTSVLGPVSRTDSAVSMPSASVPSSVQPVSTSTASISPEVQIVVSTLTDGTRTAVTTFTSTASPTGYVPASSASTGMSPEVQIVVSTLTDGTRTAMTTFTSAASPTGNVPASSASTGISPEVRTGVITSVDGTRTTLSTFTSTASTTNISPTPVTSTSVASPALAMTAPCKD
ncbi:hypothetical protein IFR04_001005 [Cadophora malorum]|uniref:Uncharacterized protein n=1 Tax=Cadophora malorum TaxID=108018 RepID=A0A8H8BW30_9HELO|nr:hypothetical protein IFR04_001005 [Cadophora malorum]